MCETNKCQGTIHTTRVEATGAPVLTKRDCEKVKTDVRDAEKAMGWLQWIATKDDGWRDPWVIFAKYNECKRLPQQLDAGAYATLRDRLQAYDRGELTMSGQDAMELRRTVNLVQMRYDNVPSPYITMPSNYISPAEQEIYDRFANNITMAVMPATIPGIAGTRAMGGTEAQARAGGELSAMAFGFMGARFMQKHGLLKQKIEPPPTRTQQTTSQPIGQQPSVKRSGVLVLERKSGSLTGRRTKINPKDDAETQRSLKRENQSADALVEKGYNVEQNPKIDGAKNPDYRINGEVYDNYAPATNSTRNIATVIEGKVNSGQTSNVVVNLSDSLVTPNQIRAQLTSYPISGLNNVLVIDKAGAVTSIKP